MPSENGVPVGVKPNIHQRIAAVIKDAGPMGKDAQAPSGAGGFKYRSIEAVVGHLRPHLAKHGVVYLPSVSDKSVTIVPHDDGPILFTTCELVVGFCNIDNPDDCVGVAGYASVRLHRDVASGIATSYALKDVLISVFQLGGNADAEGADDGPARASQPSAPRPQQASENARKSGLNFLQFMERMSSNIEGIKQSDALMANEIKFCTEMVAKFVQYGENMHPPSDKQSNWIQSIWRKYADGKPSGPSNADEACAIVRDRLGPTTKKEESSGLTSPEPPPYTEDEDDLPFITSEGVK